MKIYQVSYESLECISLTFILNTITVILFISITVPPKILRVTPTGGATIGVHNRSILTCSAEGNPLPKYQWLQKLPSQQVIYYLVFVRLLERFPCTIINICDTDVLNDKMVH